jgi:hypothetical protein
MRYLIRYWNGNEIINDLITDNLPKAIEKQSELWEHYGVRNVWMVDSLTEKEVG